jgi:hypothetical protein
MAVTSFGPLRDRIFEALTTSTGQPRALALADQFQRGYPSGVDPKLRVMRSREQPGVFVALPRIGALVGDPELGSEHMYEVTVVLSRDYYLGWAMTASATRDSNMNEVERALVKVADHFPKIRAALCYAGAHETVTSSGAATGLAGGALKGPAAESTTSITIVDSASRIVNVQDRFTAWVSWAP